LNECILLISKILIGERFMTARVKKKGAVQEGEVPHHRLFEAIAKLRNSDEAKRFFRDLCTPAELQAMADRWCVVGYVKTGESYREIHNKTGVSVTTIGRVARHLTYGEGGYDVVYKRLNENKNVKKKATASSNSKERETE